MKSLYDRLESLPQQNSALFLKFGQIMKMSYDIEIPVVAQSLKITEIELQKFLVNWKQVIPFEIVDNRIVVENYDEFTASLDEVFQIWNKNTKDCLKEA